MGADEAKALDELLFNAIPDNDMVLPDDENGLVLLSHIRQHLEGGIGLRQIIDWFMFVKAYLDDDVWFSSFQKKVRVIGLEKLAITVTKMCQTYLGLSTENITWCKDADLTLCEELMQYVMDCGNFGRNRGRLHSGGRLPSFKHPIKLFKYIQSHGKQNWKALQSYPWLCPFAWIYQSCHYINFAIQNKVNPEKIKDIYDESQKRNAMFTALGLK